MEFFVVAVLAASAVNGLDCSGVPSWKAQTYDNNPAKSVTYQGSLYTQQYWAGDNNIPGAEQWGPWQLKGVCDSGTEGKDVTEAAGPSVDGFVDCSNITPWSGAKVYSEPGHQVSFSGIVWANSGWTQSDPPRFSTIDETSPSPWKAQANCQDGTEQTTTGGSGYSEMIEKMICSCCSGCARVSGSTPECMPEGDTCYFTDCSKYNIVNEARCQEIVDGLELLYYPGTVKAASNTQYPAKVYAPYFDSGLYPFPKLTEIAKELGVLHFNAAFVVSDGRQNVTQCRGAWAGVIPVEQGPFAWDELNGENIYMYDELNKLRDMGGDVIVSFGGANNVELADSLNCHSGDPVENIFNAYDQVIDFMKLTHIDFDIEGQAVASVQRETGWKYRFAAVKKLKAKYPQLHIWWTLPIAPVGLTADGQLFIEDMMSADAPWDLINVMTMDYGDSSCPSLQMGDCEREAITNLAQNVYNAAEKTGKLATYGFGCVDDVYPKLGSTPMIGLNDVITETYYIADAKRSMEEWKSKPLGLISNWSLARDKPCKAGQNAGSAVPDCSSLSEQTEEYQFARIFQQYTTA